MRLRAYEVQVETAYGLVIRVVNHLSAGKAKACVVFDLDGAESPSSLFRKIRARSLGEPQTDAALERVQAYRNRPDLTAGREVLCGRDKRRGWIAGASSGAGAHFRVVLEDGSSVSAHPCDLSPSGGAEGPG